MSVQIKHKITGFHVIPESKQQGPAPDNLIHLYKGAEEIPRPHKLLGSTYKIKPPVSEHAFYITINDMIVNEDTPYEHRRPFEVFVNSKNMDHYQWISALTRVISAVFRKGGEIEFLVKELRSVFDPKGGYFRPGGGGFMPSLVAEIGLMIERHLQSIAVLAEPEVEAHQKVLIEEARAKMEGEDSSGGDDSFPDSAVLCAKCNVKASVMLDGCLTCLNCGDSKCG